MEEGSVLHDWDLTDILDPKCTSACCAGHALVQVGREQLEKEAIVRLDFDWMDEKGDRLIGLYWSAILSWKSADDCGRLDRFPY